MSLKLNNYKTFIAHLFIRLSCILSWIELYTKLYRQNISHLLYHGALVLGLAFKKLFYYNMDETFHNAAPFIPIHMIFYLW